MNFGQRTVVVAGCDIGVSDRDRKTGYVVLRQVEGQQLEVLEGPTCLTRASARQQIPSSLARHRADYLVVDAPLLPRRSPAPPSGNTSSGGKASGQTSCFRPHEDMVRPPKKSAIELIASVLGGVAQATDIERVLNTIQPQSTWKAGAAGLADFAAAGNDLLEALPEDYRLICDFTAVLPRGVLEGFPKAFYLPLLGLSRAELTIGDGALHARGEKDEAFLRLVLGSDSPFWQRTGLRSGDSVEWDSAFENPDTICALAMALNGVLYARGQAGVLTSAQADGSFDYGHILTPGRALFQPWALHWLADRLNYARTKYRNARIDLLDVSRAAA